MYYWANPPKSPFIRWKQKKKKNIGIVFSLVFSSNSLRSRSRSEKEFEETDFNNGGSSTATSDAEEHFIRRGLADEVNESILHAAFIPFGDIKDVKTPLDQANQKHRSFGFVTFLEREDASAAMDNMDGAELYGRVLTVNYALPEKIKGGEQGWAAHPRTFQLLFLFSF